MAKNNCELLPCSPCFLPQPRDPRQGFSKPCKRFPWKASSRAPAAFLHDSNCEAFLERWHLLTLLFSAAAPLLFFRLPSLPLLQSSFH